MVVQALLVFQLFSAPTERTRAAELSEMALKERILAQEREAAARLELERQRFEQRFNQLVDAVASFAREYNQGKGQVWPKPQADRLSKAMLELQSLDGSRFGKTARKPACANPGQP